MKKYRVLRNALEMFSVQLGLDDEAARRMLQRSLSNPTWREELVSDLNEVLVDPDVRWCALVANDDYEIDEPETEEEAKSIVLRCLWSVVFPDRKMPVVKRTPDSA